MHNGCIEKIDLGVGWILRDCGRRQSRLLPRQSTLT